jgi:lysophospholipase L1-like esterase
MLGLNCTLTPVAGAIRKGITVPLGAIKIATYGDSRSQLAGIPAADLYDGASRNFRIAFANQPTAFASIPLYMADVVLTADGGVSGEYTSGWSSAGRGTSKGPAVVAALDWDVMVMQYGTNDTANVTTIGQRDSVATAAIANIKACITYFLATGRKVVFQTIMQRTAAGFITNAALRQECTDIMNYGNGGAIDGLVPWCQAHVAYGSQLYVHDIQALINVGGASTGAYADGTWFTDGTHPNYYGARRIAASLAVLLRSIYASRGFPTMHRAVGNNFIPAVSSTYYGGEVLTNCARSAITYATDANGRAYGQVTITPNNVTAGSYKFELLADVGTNSGRTPVGGTIATNDLVEGRVFLTLDDGSGGISVVNNVAIFVMAAYIGGTPANQLIQNGTNSQGTTLHGEADNEFQYVVQPLKITGDSSLIGAPAAGSGHRMWIQVLFGVTPTPFRVRWTAPEIRKVV